MFSVKDCELAREIVRSFDIPKTNFCDENNFCDTVNSMRKKFPSLHFDYGFGVTRFVLIVDELPFVIKIAFDGTWDYDEDMEDEYYREFPFDYNEKEMEMIDKLSDNGFGALVPDMEYLCHHKSHSVYIQTKIPYNAYDSRVKRPSERVITISNSLSLLFTQCNSTWRATVIDLYGEEFWKSFVNWDMANGIGIFEDMHGDNYGYDVAGHPMFIDVAGYQKQNQTICGISF